MGSGMIRRLAFLAAALALPAAVHAQYIGGNAPPPPPAPVPGYAESPSAALARNVRLLAINPRNYEALLGAGKAALATGDTESAVGFYGRAEEINPRSWVPKIGQGAALVQMMEPRSALTAFAEAQQLGASQVSLALDRGLAFDLVGDQARAQSDYRVALGGVDRDEARRRLALSLAISGKRLEALAMLDPLLARRDRGAVRARAFILALTGDVEGARSAVRGALPGLAGTMDPFLVKLAGLRSTDKAAAVHLGVMPGAGGLIPSTQVYAQSPVSQSPVSQPPVSQPRVSQAPVVAYRGPAPLAGGSVVSPPAGPTGADRLADIDRFLAPQASQGALGTAAPAAPGGPPAAVPAPAPAATKLAANTAASAAQARSRYWLQIGSGEDAARLPQEFRRLASRHRDAFEGLSGFVAEDGGRARLLIGPFRNAGEARTFADDLATLNIDASQWTSAPGQAVRKIAER